MLADRAVIRVVGDDPRGFLQGLVTSDVAGSLPVWAGLLSAQGKALFDFLLWDDGADVLIDCEEGHADALVRRLTLYRLRRALTIARAPELAVHWAVDGEAGVPDPRLAALGRRWLGPPGTAADGWRPHRLALGVTEGAAELGQDRTLWLEANADLLGGVSFTKGCYVGQENTARMNWRQKVARRLLVFRTDGDPGDAANAYYPADGFAVARVRVEAIRPEMMLGGVPAAPIVPEWLREALNHH